MVGMRASQAYPSEVANVLETRSEKIIADYERRLLEMDSPLVAEASTREQLKAQAYSILKDVAITLRSKEGSSQTGPEEDPLSECIGESRARERVHASESLRAVVALSEAALSVVVDNLPPSQVSRTQVAAVALAIQKSVMEHVARASVSYVNYLLSKVHESHADERRRIGRELHDRVAHSIMVVFRSLELHEMYKAQESTKAQEKLEFAKKMAQEALKSARYLSSELRQSSAEEGLEVALSEHLRIIVPPSIDARVSTEGDESLIVPEVRDELFLVLREAVRNAVTHARARKIRIKLCTAKDKLKASVEDDGRGFDPDEAKGSGNGTGLVSMRERVALLGGALNLLSTSEDGTRVEVSVPLPRRPREH